MILWGALGIALNVGIARFTYGVMLPSLRNDLGLDYLASGSLNAIHLAGYLIGTLFAPSLGRRMATWKMSRAAHLLVAAGAVACALAPSASVPGFLAVAVGRLATGIGAGVGIVATFVIVFEAVSAARRPLVSAAVWSGMNLAIVVSGLAVAGLLETAIGWRVAFGLSAVIALAVAAGFPPAPMRTQAGAAQIPLADAPFRASGIFAPRWIFLSLAYFCFGVAYVAYSTFAGVRLAAIGAPIFVIGATWTGFGIASMVGSLATIGLLNAEKVKRLALAAALLFGALGALVASGDSSVAAFAGALLVGLGLAAVPTIVSAYVRERSSAADYPKTFSVATALLGIGQLIGPLAGGAVGDWLGSAAIPLFAAGAYGFGALLAMVDAAVVRRR